MRSDSKVIVVVSGLPRSGTSMMMRMLEAGGMPLLTDATRAADGNNPRGYYEFEAVKGMKTDSTWIGQAQGKAVKIVAPLVRWLPAGHSYAVIFLRRDLDEVLASQDAMMGGAEADARAAMKQRFRQELNTSFGWLSTQPGLRVFYQDYRRVVQEPGSSARAIRDFLGRDLDIAAMAATVEPALYRQRAAGPAHLANAPLKA